MTTCPTKKDAPVSSAPSPRKASQHNKSSVYELLSVGGLITGGVIFTAGAYLGNLPLMLVSGAVNVAATGAKLIDSKIKGNSSKQTRKMPKKKAPNIGL